jgi:cytoskeletal protein CcmA (bactofilin family)
MASFTQGAPLPNITTTQSQTTTAPDWYNDYLKNLSANATTAGAGADFVGANALQNQAFNNVSTNVGNYQPLLNAATGQVNQAGNMSAYGAGSGALNQSMGMSGAQAGANAFNQSMGMSGSDAAANYLDQSAGMSGAQAGQAGINAAMQTAPSNIQQYMNPYMSNVVDEAGRLGMQNIRNTLSPQATSGAVGSGQFGSTRGANVLAQNLTGALQNLGGQQQGLLASGYQNAMQSSQADMARQLQAGVAAGQLTAADAQRLMQTGQIKGQLTEAEANRLMQTGQAQGQLTAADAQRMMQTGQIQGQLTQADIDSKLRASQQYGALAGQTQSMGLADVNALSTMGAQQQQIDQNRELFPLQVAEKQAALMKGYTVPTSVSSSYTGPIPNAYQTSPLMQISSLGSGVAGLFTPGSGGKAPIDEFTKFLKSFGGSGNDFNYDFTDIAP